MLVENIMLIPKKEKPRLSELVSDSEKEEKEKVKRRVNNALSRSL
jgi:hypothetical protein